jgi:hypothetical protein
MAILAFYVEGNLTKNIIYVILFAAFQHGTYPEPAKTAPQYSILFSGKKLFFLSLSRSSKLSLPFRFLIRI